MTTTLSTIFQRISEQLGDWFQEDTTTNITTNTSIISTALRQWDRGQNDTFNRWWVYITEGNNIGVERQISDYATTTGTITVFGASLAAEAGAVTIWVSRYSRADKLKAINDAVRECSNNLFRYKDVATLVTGNILPNSHFEDWAVSTAPDKWTMQDSNITAAASTTAGTYRGGAKSMKATTGAGGAGKYVLLHSDNYPRLLDLMNTTVSAYVWALPEVADDAALEIYTKQADGTAQTLTSTTTNPAGEFTLLKLEDKTLNDDLVEVQVRFKVATASKYVYYDAARLTGKTLYEYLLPTDFWTGHLKQVWIQTAGSADDPCDDLFPKDWERIWGWEIVPIGTDKYLRIPSTYSNVYQIRTSGTYPLETLSADTDTLSIDGQTVNLLVAYAKYKLLSMKEDPPASQDIKRFESASAKAYREYQRLLTGLSMPSPPGTLRLRTW